MPDLPSLPPPPRRSNSNHSSLSSKVTNAFTSSPLASPPLSTPSTSPEVATDPSKISPTAGNGPAFRRKPVPIISTDNLTAQINSGNEKVALPAPVAFEKVADSQDIPFTQYNLSVDMLSDSGHGEKAAGPPVVGPRTSSAVGLGIEHIANPTTNGVPNSRIHYLRAARSKNGSIHSTGSSPLSSPVTTTFGEQAEGVSSPSQQSPSHPLAGLDESDLNKSLPSLPPPSVVDASGLSSAKKSKKKDDFTEDGIPDAMALWEASQCYITDEYGRPRKFGEFWDRTDIRKDPAMEAKRAAAEAEYKAKQAKKAAKHRGSTTPRSAGSLHSGRAESIRSASTASRPRSDSVVSVNTITSGSSARTIQQPVATADEELKVGGEEWNVPGRKTVVFWIRHFWCGQCQDFTFASISLLDPVAINAAGINVMVISNGSWKIIKRYRELFKCPYPIYVDPSRTLYKKMGMTKLNNDFGPRKDRAAYHQTAVPKQFIRGVNAALFKMPIHYPGRLVQLGGEFVLGPGLKCDFAHRMTTTSNHREAFDVVAEAGCANCTVPDRNARDLQQDEMDALIALQQEEAQWREGRTDELRRMKMMKAERRGQEYEESVANRLSTLSMGTGLGGQSREDISVEDEGLEDDDGQTEDGMTNEGPATIPDSESAEDNSEVYSEQDNEDVPATHSSYLAEYEGKRANRRSVPDHMLDGHGHDDDDTETISYEVDSRPSNGSTDAFVYDDEEEHVEEHVVDDGSSYAGDTDVMSRRLSRLTLGLTSPDLSATSHGRLSEVSLGDNHLSGLKMSERVEAARVQ